MKPCSYLGSCLQRWRYAKFRGIARTYWGRYDVPQMSYGLYNPLWTFFGRCDVPQMSYGLYNPLRTFFGRYEALWTSYRRSYDALVFRLEKPLAGRESYIRYSCSCDGGQLGSFFSYVSHVLASRGVVGGLTKMDNSLPVLFVNLAGITGTVYRGSLVVIDNVTFAWMPFSFPLYP